MLAMTVAGSVLAILITPWHYVAITAIGASLVGLLDRWRTSRPDDRSPGHLITAVLAGGVLVGVISSGGGELFTAVWTPHEVIEISQGAPANTPADPKGNSATEIVRLRGYVLGNSNDYVTFLASKTRVVQHYRTVDVVRRTTCRLSRGPGAGHLHESLLQLARRHFLVGLPLCSSLHPQNV